MGGSLWLKFDFPRILASANSSNAAWAISISRYLSQLQEHFSEDEAWAQLETIIDWGRYVELFSYIEDRGVFRLEEQETQEENKK